MPSAMISAMDEADENPVDALDEGHGPVGHTLGQYHRVGGASYRLLEAGAVNQRIAFPRARKPLGAAAQALLNSLVLACREERALT